MTGWFSGMGSLAFLPFLLLFLLIVLRYPLSEFPPLITFFSREHTLPPRRTSSLSLYTIQRKEANVDLLDEIAHIQGNKS